MYIVLYKITMSCRDRSPPPEASKMHFDKGEGDKRELGKRSRKSKQQTEKRKWGKK